jgi:hypothetical protein
LRGSKNENLDELQYHPENGERGLSNFWVNKFGRAGNVDAAMDVYDVSTGDYEFPSVAFETRIAGLANDDVSSDGVHSVRVEGLDSNGVEITEVATLTGATPVVLANSYYRINRAYVEAVGASLVNSGNIDITHTGSATLARISPQEGQTLQAVYTMPAGVSGNVVGWRADAAREATQVVVQASLRLQTRNPGAGWRTRDSGLAGNTNSLNRGFKTPQSVVVRPLTDIRVRVTAVNTDDGVVSAGFEVEGFRDIR